MNTPCELSPSTPNACLGSSSYRRSSPLRLAFCLWVLLYTEVEAQTLTSEMDALREFQNLTSVWFQNSSSGGFTYQPRGYWDSWKTSDENPCKWVGITCTTSDSVYSIDLSGWGLTRFVSISPLNRLGNLEELILSRNNFNAKIPEDIGTLTNLRQLDLSDSAFFGELPSNLALLWNLRFLYLGGNRFTGGIPRLDNLTELQVLSLSRNQLDGPIPKYLNNVASLVTLDLSINSFNDSVPVFTNLINLHELKLQSNSLTGFTDPRFPGPENLKQLFTSRNQFTGILPVGLTEMVDLIVLDMSFNHFSGEIPEGLARQTTQSYWLDLSNNQFEGRIPNDLFLPSGTTRALYLNLSYNLLMGSIREVQSMKKDDFWYFAALDLSHNRLNGSLPLLFTSIGSKFFPRRVRLEYNQLTGDVINAIKNWDFAQEIRLANNRFTGDLTSMIENLEFPAFKLEILDLSNNLLIMSKTEKYSDPLRNILESFYTMTLLKEFRIAGNKFEEISLPTISLLRGPKALEVLDVSSNHLVGHIEEVAFDPLTFPKMKILNFSDNNLTGAVPLDITRLPNLIALDVSLNSLSGKLPDIPKDSSLWNADFFAGNPGLCSAPLPACPSETSVLDPVVIYVKDSHLSKARLIAIILSSVLIPLASCSIVGWRLRLYKKLHQQDADLIATLLERETTALMPLRELKRATDNFSDTAQIGEGGFGTVYKGKLQDGTVVAIKKNKREGTEADKQQFLNEVRILSQVSHRHLVKLLGCCMENKAALLVFEFVPNGTLQEHLQGKQGSRLSWEQRIQIAVQTAHALTYLHSAAHFPIVHRDVKSANILLTETLEVKVADFGISKLAPAASTEATHFSTVAVQGTMGYIDPEYFTCLQLTTKSDVYSFGVVLLELISAQAAIDFQRPPADASLTTYAKHLIENGEFQSFIDPFLMNSGGWQFKESMMSVGNLALQCLQAGSKERPDIKEVWNELQILSLDLNALRN